VNFSSGVASAGQKTFALSKFGRKSFEDLSLAMTVRQKQFESAEMEQKRLS
jgi:hypothetical protein